MPRRRNTFNFPSFRNLQIYHAFACERRTQNALAKQLGLSQRRISQITQDVKSWVDSLVSPSQFAAHDGKRFHLAVARERIRLQDAYDPVVAMFTGPDGFPRYLRRYITVVGGEVLNTVEVSDKPDFRLLNQAVYVASRLAQLEAIAQLGPFANLPNQIDQSIVHHTGAAAPPVAVFNATKAAASANNGLSNANHSPSKANEILALGLLTQPPSSPQPPAPLPVTLIPVLQNATAKTF